MFNQFSVSMYQMCSVGQLLKFFKSLMLLKHAYCLCLYAFYVETCYRMLCAPCSRDLRVKVI